MIDLETRVRRNIDQLIESAETETIMVIIETMIKYQRIVIEESPRVFDEECFHSVTEFGNAAKINLSTDIEWV